MGELGRVRPVATGAGQAKRGRIDQHELAGLHCDILPEHRPGREFTFAERGLATARSTSNRDFEDSCLELSEAARRQMK